MSDASHSYAYILSGLFLVWWKWWICSSAWLDTDVFWCRPGQDGGAASQLHFDRAAMSCRQHSLLTILMMTTDPHTLISLCTLCTTNAWERINDPEFPLYKHSTSFQLVSEGRFWLGPDTRWRKKKFPSGISQCKLSTGNPSEGFKSRWIRKPHIVSKCCLHSILI